MVDTEIVSSLWRVSSNNQPLPTCLLSTNFSLQTSLLRGLSQEDRSLILGSPWVFTLTVISHLPSPEVFSVKLLRILMWQNCTFFLNLILQSHPAILVHSTTIHPEAQNQHDNFFFFLQSCKNSRITSYSGKYVDNFRCCRLNGFNDE